MKIKNGVLISIDEKKDIKNGICNIPDGVASIGDGAFEGCTSLESINIPNSVTSIGNYAFYFCIALKEISLPDSVIRIENNAFDYCKALKELKIPDNAIMFDFPSHLPANQTKVYYRNKTYANIDGIVMVDISTPKPMSGYENLTVSQAKYANNNEEKCYIAFIETEGNKYSAHGEFSKEGLQNAISDVFTKYYSNGNVSGLIKAVIAKDTLNASDYRMITGACRAGTQHFIDMHNDTHEDKMDWCSEIPLVEALEITKES